MDGCYPIFMSSRETGQVRVEKQGLYLRFCCRCRSLADGISRVVMRWEDREECLGVLAPKDGEFRLERRIPTKTLPDGVPDFLIRKEGSVEGIFVPICPEEPFAYLHRLKDAYLERRNGVLGVAFKESRPIGE